MYSINFTATKKKFSLSLHYSGVNSYLFVGGTEIYKFKDSEIVPAPSCLGNISKDWSVDDMKRTRFTLYVYDFSIDSNSISVDNIKDAHKYLMKNNYIVQYAKQCIKRFGLLKNVFLLEHYFYQF